MHGKIFISTLSILGLMSIIHAANAVDCPKKADIQWKYLPQTNPAYEPFAYEAKDSSGNIWYGENHDDNLTQFNLSEGKLVIENGENVCKYTGDPKKISQDGDTQERVLKLKVKK